METCILQRIELCWMRPGITRIGAMETEVEHVDMWLLYREFLK